MNNPRWRAGPARIRSRSGRAANFLPIWSCSVWGLPCLHRYRRSGALLPHLFTLTCASCETRAVFSLWHWPSRGLDAAIPDVIRHTALRSSDFPLPGFACAHPAAAARPACIPYDSSVFHANPLNQKIEHRRLTLHDPLPRGLGRKPLSAIHFRDFYRSAGAGRPRDGASVADQLLRIAVTLDRPNRNQLPAGLLYLSQLKRIALDREAGLLTEFALRGFQRGLAFRILSLGNRPCSQVLFRPERTSGMDQKHLQAAPAPAIHEQPRAKFRHARPLAPK